MDGLRWSCTACHPESTMNGPPCRHVIGAMGSEIQRMVDIDGPVEINVTQIDPMHDNPWWLQLELMRKMGREISESSRRSMDAFERAIIKAFGIPESVMDKSDDLSPRGDIWAVPRMPRIKWEMQSIDVRGAVHKALHDGWGGKLADAHRLTGHKAFTIAVAMAADDLGAPVGQMFTACSLRVRAGR